MYTLRRKFLNACVGVIVSLASAYSYSDQITLDTNLGDVDGSTKLSVIQNVIAPSYDSTKQTVEDLSKMEHLTTNNVQDIVSSIDTSYFRVNGITNKNQSIQYIVNNSTEPWNLDIVIPYNGDTKDWIVYVYSATNATVRLPTSNDTIIWWSPIDSIVDDIKPSIPTAFYFSQVAENIFVVNRQELTALSLSETNKVQVINNN